MIYQFLEKCGDIIDSLPKQVARGIFTIEPAKAGAMQLHDFFSPQTEGNWDRFKPFPTASKLIMIFSPTGIIKYSNFSNKYFKTIKVVRPEKLRNYTKR